MSLRPGSHFALVRNDMLKEEACARVQGRLVRKVRRNLPGVSGCKGLPPLSLRGAKRRGNPRPCRNAWQIGCCLGEFVGGYEFALSAAICHVPPQGERIATPVCALVRNDMQKFAGCLRNTRALPGECRETYLLCVRVTVLCMSLRGAKRRGNPLLLAVEHDRKQHFRRIRKSCEFAPTATNLSRFSAWRTDCHTSVRTGSQ